MNNSLVTVFSDRTEDIKSIFSSYKTLYTIYVTTLKNVKANPNSIQAIENAKGSVEKEQKKISNLLHAQGFILLTGAAEALLKDMFVSLLRENFTEIHAPSVNFSAKEMQDILKQKVSHPVILESVSAELGNLTVEKLFSTKNPIEKVNFQNTETTKDVMKNYFEIELSDSEYLKSIHKYWQMRHSLVHSGGKIDQRYITNVGKVEMLGRSEKLGKRIAITKAKFDEANEDFLNLFNELDQLIEATCLKLNLRSPDTTIPSKD
jgi:hypothetical protein